jgi:signal transduction histidine kinase
MIDKISDFELLAELKSRFMKNRLLHEEQGNLLLQLHLVNEKLITSELLKSNFLSNIRNEINNPIASILELSKNISRGDITQESIRKFGTLIYSEAFNLDFQLRNIFFSAEIEAGESTISVISVNIFSLINSVITSFSHQLNKKEITLKANLNFSENQFFYTDAEKLHLILSNLLSNAIQYSNEKGVIEIDGKIINKQLVISITDKGIGINEAEKGRIFDRFKQLEEGSTKSYGGHGLGLSITKALLEILQGSISLESKKDEGSTFEIKIIESEIKNENDQIVSIDGNDFLFNNDNEMIF